MKAMQEESTKTDIKGRINQNRHKSYNYNDNIADTVTKKAFTHSYIYMSTIAMIKSIQKSHTALNGLMLSNCSNKCYSTHSIFK